MDFLSGCHASNGSLSKAFLHVIDRGWGGFPRDGGADFVFNYNPAAITVEKSTEFKEHSRHGLDSGDKEWTHGTSRKLALGNLYFDTFEERQNVRRRYIDKLEALVHQDPDLKRPPKVLFQWGRFMSENDSYNSCPWYVTRIKVVYVMFLSDGTPVRARVEIDLIEATPAGDQISRQTATGNGDREITAGTDDTLTGIATRFYDSPEEWQNIALASGIENPLADLDGIKLKLGRRNKE